MEQQKQADKAAENPIVHPLQSSKSKKASKTFGSKASISTFSEQPTKGYPFLSDPQELVTNKRTKGPLEMSLHNDARHISRQDIARCINTNGMAFNVVCSPHC